MTTTVADVYERAARRIGARTGTLGTVTVGATTTTAILNGLVNTTGDNQGFPAGDRLLLLASAAGSQEALVIAWDDATGTATFKNLTAPPVAGDRYLAVNREDYTLNEFDQAWAEVLREGRRTYRQVIPITPNLDLYPLAVCDWLRGAGDIDAAWLGQSPLWLHNEDVSLWQAGAASAPDGYTLEGVGAAVARLTGGRRSQYQAQVTGGAAVARLTQALPASLNQWLTRRTSAVFTPLRAAAWLTTTDASAVRVFIRYTEYASGAPVTTYAYSAYARADGEPQFLEASLTPSATMDDFTWGIEVAAGKACQYSAGVFMQNTTVASNSFAIRDQGSQAYLEQPIQKAVRNVGGTPTIELTAPVYTLWQLVVYVRRPFAQTSAYTDAVDDQYARQLEFGLLAWLLVNDKPNQDRARLDKILYGDRATGEPGVQREWARFLANTVDLPVPRPPQRAEVWGA